jgi:hypothetical protein
MSKENDRFIKEGIKRYKQADLVYHTFRSEMQKKLQSILLNRKIWGNLKPDFKSIRSTTFKGAALNARIRAEYKGEVKIIVIIIDWQLSETDFPYFCVWLEDSKNTIISVEEIDWGDKYFYENKTLQYRPDPETYDLKKDFNNLLDEFIKAFDN